ncbi:MAG: SCP-like extracellular [Oscillospiraceae bacterium]|nr:SCP-like extracellular [Oscillospiraceae bacterium]
MKRLISTLLSAALASVMLISFASAADTSQTCAQRLYGLGLLQGTGTYSDGTPNFDLDSSTTRAQAVTMLVRLLGQEDTALSEDNSCPFTDVPSWAEPYVSYAYQNGLTKGVSDTQFGSDDQVTCNQYATLLLRALGYSDESGSFSWTDAASYASNIGLDCGSYSGSQNLNRGDVATLSSSALDQAVVSSGKTLLQCLNTSNTSDSNQATTQTTSSNASNSTSKSNTNSANNTGKTTAGSTNNTGNTTTGSANNTGKSTTNSTNNTGKTTTTNTTSTTQQSGTTATYIQAVVNLVNEARAEEGLPALTLDSTITSAAMTRASEIRTSFSHTRPDGTSCFTALDDAGVSYRASGENIAYGQSTPSEVVTAWLNSSEHRANIMSTSFTRIGVGYTFSNGTAYWTQLFCN